MQELKTQFKIFFYSIPIIFVSITTFYFTNHNNVKEHINMQSDHLSNNISQVDSKLDESKKETQEDFNKINEKIDKMIDKMYKNK